MCFNPMQSSLCFGAQTVPSLASRALGAGSQDFRHSPVVRRLLCFLGPRAVPVGLCVSCPDPPFLTGHSTPRLRPRAQNTTGALLLLSLFNEQN